MAIESPIKTGDSTSNPETLASDVGLVREKPGPCSNLSLSPGARCPLTHQHFLNHYHLPIKQLSFLSLDSVQKVHFIYRIISFYLCPYFHSCKIQFQALFSCSYKFSHFLVTRHSRITPCRFQFWHLKNQYP